MEQNEILAELAQSIGQIVDKKVAEKKPTFADAFNSVIEAIDNGTIENEIDGSVEELLSKIRLAFTSKYDDFVSDNKAEDDSCQSSTAFDTVKNDIENGDLDKDEVADLLEAINNESQYDDEVADLVRNEADNYGFVDKDDIDEYYIFDNLDDCIICDVAKRYINENL